MCVCIDVYIYSKPKTRHTICIRMYKCTAYTYRSLPFLSMCVTTHIVSSGRLKSLFGGWMDGSTSVNKSSLRAHTQEGEKEQWVRAIYCDSAVCLRTKKEKRTKQQTGACFARFACMLTSRRRGPSP